MSIARSDSVNIKCVSTPSFKMHSSVLTLGLFAVAALTSPLVNDKGDPDPIYVTKVITNSWVTTVAAAPAAWIPSEEETHRRHRHTGRAGSRLPAKYEYGYSLPTLESLPAITGLADISDTATLGADLSPTPKASGVSIQTNAPTETLRFEAPVVVPTLNVDKVETSTCESAVVKLSNTEAPTVTVLKTEPAPELEKVETSTVESFSVKNFESVPAPVDIPDFKTHTDPFPPVQYVPFLDPTSPTYKALVLQHHNIHRQNHSAVDLVWNDTMAKYAETTAKTCVWEHNL